MCQTNWSGQSLGLGTVKLSRQPELHIHRLTAAFQQCSSARRAGQSRDYILGCREMFVRFSPSGWKFRLVSSVWSCLPLVAALHQGLGGSAQRLRLSALPNQNLSHRICKQLTLPHCVFGAALPPCTGIISSCARPQAWKTWDVAQINHYSLIGKQSF